MIPLLVMLGAMIVGLVAPQVARREAMRGVYAPPRFERKLKPIRIEDFPPMEPVSVPNRKRAAVV